MPPQPHTQSQQASQTVAFEKEHFLLGIDQQWDPAGIRKQSLEPTKETNVTPLLHDANKMMKSTVSKPQNTASHFLQTIKVEACLHHGEILMLVNKIDKLNHFQN